MVKVDVKYYKYNMKPSIEFVKLYGIISSFCCFLASAQSCTKVNACSCKTDSGHVIDLKPLAKTDGTPAYDDIPDPGGQGDAYAWNPCNAFTISDCNNVASCHEVVSGPISQYIPLGTQDTADFEYDGDQLTLIYTDSTQNQKSVVKLVCDDTTEGDFTALGQDVPPTGVYSFQLKSKYICESLPSKNSGSGGLSIGSYICIAFGCFIVLYIVIGIVIQIFIRKESGKRAIPNHDFWVAVPAYIKDGTLFIVGRGRQKTYNKI